MVTLDEAKNHLRVGHDLDDAYIQMLIDAAGDYLRGAISPNYEANDSRGRLLALAMIAEWYDNRSLGQSVSGNTRQAVTSFLMQLRAENGGVKDD